METEGLSDEAVDGDDLGVQGNSLIQSQVWGTLRGRSCRTGGRGGRSSENLVMVRDLESFLTHMHAGLLSR